MPVPAFLSRLFAKPQRELQPPTPDERQRLAHRRRAVERELRSLEKTLKRIGCSTCVQQAPSKNAILMERHASALRAEIGAIDRRLAQS